MILDKATAKKGPLNNIEAPYSAYCYSKDYRVYIQQIRTNLSTHTWFVCSQYAKI